MKIAAFVIGLVFSIILLIGAAQFSFIGLLGISLSGETRYIWKFILFLIFSIMALVGSIFSLSKPEKGYYYLIYSSIGLALSLYELLIFTAIPIILIFIAGVFSFMASREERKNRNSYKYETNTKSSEDVCDFVENFDFLNSHPKRSSKTSRKEKNISTHDMKVKIKYDLIKRNMFYDNLKLFYEEMTDIGFLKEAYEAYSDRKKSTPNPNEKNELYNIMKNIKKYL